MMTVTKRRKHPSGRPLMHIEHKPLPIACRADAEARERKTYRQCN
jgi:hypothetical protein